MSTSNYCIPQNASTFIRISESMPEVNNSTLGKSSIIGKILLHIGNWLKQGVGEQVWFVPHTAAWKVYIVIYFS